MGGILDSGCGVLAHAKVPFSFTPFRLPVNVLCLHQLGWNIVVSPVFHPSLATILGSLSAGRLLERILWSGRTLFFNSAQVLRRPIVIGSRSPVRGGLM